MIGDLIEYSREIHRPISSSGVQGQTLPLSRLLECINFLLAGIVEAHAKKCKNLNGFY
jgi:hypothetical protein